MVKLIMEEIGRMMQIMSAQIMRIMNVIMTKEIDRTRTILMMEVMGMNTKLRFHHYHI